MSGSSVKINDTGSSVSIGGSSLKGYINATYEELQAVFGSDIGNLSSDDIIGLALPKDDKVSSEFRFDCTVRYEDNPDEEEYVKGAIYSWKTDKSPSKYLHGTLEDTVKKQYGMLRIFWMHIV